MQNTVVKRVASHCKLLNEVSLIYKILNYRKHVSVLYLMYP